jgi:hypothetical protein
VTFFSDGLSFMSFSSVPEVGMRFSPAGQSSPRSFTFRLRDTDAQKAGDGACVTIHRADRIRLYPGRKGRPAFTGEAALTRRGLQADGRLR